MSSKLFLGTKLAIVLPLLVCWALLLSNCRDESSGNDSETTPEASVVGPCPSTWTPDFIPDPELYPFRSNCFQSSVGTLHYVDEGPKTAAHTVLFVHGNPNWSFLHQDAMIHAIERGHRVVSLDQPGFGLSAKPTLEEFSYLPRDQADLLDELFEHLNLNNVTIVVHDWGGPIGLAVASRHPDRISNL
jgi:hypothetical protein